MFQLQLQFQLQFQLQLQLQLQLKFKIEVVLRTSLKGTKSDFRNAARGDYTTISADSVS